MPICPTQPPPSCTRLGWCFSISARFDVGEIFPSVRHPYVFRFFSEYVKNPIFRNWFNHWAGPLITAYSWKPFPSLIEIRLLITYLWWMYLLSLPRMQMNSSIVFLSTDTQELHIHIQYIYTYTNSYVQWCFLVRLPVNPSKPWQWAQCVSFEKLPQVCATHPIILAFRASFCTRECLSLSSKTSGTAYVQL